MRRPNAQRVAALLTFLAVALRVESAPAAAWSWACRGEVGGQRIAFDRDGLYIAGGKGPGGRPGMLDAQSIREAVMAVKRGGDFTEFRPEDYNNGLAGPITFTRTDDNKQKQGVVFTERSSNQILHKHRLVCGRDEDTDLYRKVYRYQRDGEPAREISMQCMEYQLSTRGGRKGCH
jgi:hypothetical protein